MDMYDTPEEVVVRAEISGVDKDNLEVEISTKALKISGSRSEPQCLGNTTYRLAEIQYGTFERILYLPSPIDTEKISTSFNNGLLEIKLSKVPRDVAHKIPISDG